MSTAQLLQTELAIACTMNAIAPEHRDRHTTIALEIYASVQALQALPDGYALRLPTESAMLLKVAEYITNERLCCAFVRFTLVIEPNGGPFWLHLTGGAGVKEYMESALATLVKKELAEDIGVR